MFEFDENKSKSNFKKHGIDFYTAQKLWNDPFRIEIPARISEGEMRYLLIAGINNENWSAVYTIRDQNIRIISVRKSREHEKKIYNNERI